MKPSRAIAFWVAVLAVLVLVEVGEVTHLFTLPVQSVLGNLLSFIFALVFVTILALVGAIFIGVYISQRLLSSSGFTPFEEEMLQMRADVKAIRERLVDLERRRSEDAPAKPPGGP